MKTMREVINRGMFKVGDIVTVVGNSNGHEFPLGTDVRLTKDLGNDWKAEYLNGSAYWFVVEKDIIPKPELKETTDKGKDIEANYEYRHQDWKKDSWEPVYVDIEKDKFYRGTAGVWDKNISPWSSIELNPDYSTRPIKQESPEVHFKVGDRVILLGNRSCSIHDVGTVGYITEISNYDEARVSAYNDLDEKWNWSYFTDLAHYEEPTNNVNSPSHYNESSIECIEAIRATLGPEGFQAYCKGNCLKYLWRYKYKNGVEDLEKSQVYLKWMVESMKEEEEDDS